MTLVLLSATRPVTLVLSLLPEAVLLVSSKGPDASGLSICWLSSRDKLLEDGHGDSKPSAVYLNQVKQCIKCKYICH